MRKGEGETVVCRRERPGVMLVGRNVYICFRSPRSKPLNLAWFQVTTHSVRGFIVSSAVEV